MSPVPDLRPISDADQEALGIRLAEHYGDDKASPLTVTPIDVQDEWIAHFGFDGPSKPTAEQSRHGGHRVVAIEPHVWFCRPCGVQFDGEPDVSGSIFDESSTMPRGGDEL